MKSNNLQTLKEKEYTVDELPIWNFDGSSTGQAPGDNSDVYLKPVAIFPSPFLLSPNILVLAECWNADGTPNKFNYRHEAAKLMKAHEAQEPWFGLEQEYTLLDMNDRPYGWPTNGYPAPQGPYYCGNGAGKVVQRDIVEAHYKGKKKKRKNTEKSALRIWFGLRRLYHHISLAQGDYMTQRNCQLLNRLSTIIYIC